MFWLCATLSEIATFYLRTHLMSDGRKTVETFDLDLLRQGDRQEFARLVEEYSGPIYRLGLKMLQESQDAEDILQETFIKAYKHLPDFDGRSSVSTWLYRIATNEALMMLRRRKHPTISIDDPLDSAEQDQEPLQIVDWCCMPEEELLTSEARSAMDQAVAALPDSLRTVFLLRDIEGLSTLETADVLNLSEMAVKTRLSRARMRLREQLTQYYSERIARRRSVEEEVL
jgi:RNA polymerase sigma-70 factor, ECF subfamily